jgi:hypothetical protein
MCLDFFRKRGKSCFSRIYIFSPSVLVDGVWKPVIHMCRSELGQDDAKEPFLFESYNPDDLERVIATQQEVIKRAKEAGLKGSSTCSSSSMTSLITLRSLDRSGWFINCLCEVATPSSPAW